MKDTRKIFDEKIKPIFTYIGFIGAIIMSIAYIVVIFILIVGFKEEKSFTSTLIFAAINAAVGLIILLFLKVQGQTFAAEIPENKELLKKYYERQAKEKKSKSINYYWITSTIKDVIIKGITILITTCGVIYIVIQGSNDWNMLLLAIVNLLMFISFGMLALVKTYDFYNNNHIPYIKEKLREAEKCQKENLISKKQSDSSQTTIKPVVDSTSKTSSQTLVIEKPGLKACMLSDNLGIGHSITTLKMENLPKLAFFSEVNKVETELQVQEDQKVKKENKV